MKITGNTILITGAGSGIGRALAQEFHSLGNKLIITGRRKHKLDEVLAANPGMIAYELDVQDRVAVSDFARMITAHHPTLNVVINNAGIMLQEDLSEGESALDQLDAMVQTNFLGPVRLNAALIQHLLTQIEATIINVGSGLAHVPLTLVPNYCATKAAIHSYTQSLRHQLRNSPIEVVEIIPPAVHTGLLGLDQPAPHEMPLPVFIAEVMALFHQQPTPQEICVENVGPLRHAESGDYGAVFAQVNQGIVL
ncbi:MULTISPECIES: SDR family oxidoreductase [unclassified Pseudomonas]|uniref:SDR family oxidoreductase n=1 Tax=unclassified Pseudomonas TaxID=196821 RepID=UPI0025E8692C|nr:MULTISPECIES: SDR family oxidoreductase [unclassified Pseudomonas]